MNNSIVGRGWSFPIHLNDLQKIALTADDETEINQSIRIILSTMPGERVMRPTFGSRLHELVFEPMNPETATRARRLVEEALRLWEPRITVTDVEIHLAQDDSRHEGQLEIVLHYEIKATHDQYSLVYPFYLLPAEAPVQPTA